MTQIIKLGNKIIGKGKKTFVIAEIGINHQGDFQKCKTLIKEASKCGADAAKIQLVNLEESYNEDTKSFKEFKNKSFSDQQLITLKKFAKKNNILFFYTPGDISSLKRLIKLKFDLIKISSGLSNNFPLLREAIKSKIPLIISTGMSNKQDLIELKLFLNKFNFNKIVILKCVSTYPTNLKEINLKTFLTLKKIFNYNIGYSDHSLGNIACISAVSLGACVLEKHFTLNKKLIGADHKISLEPKEFKEMVIKVREAEKILGKENKMLSLKLSKLRKYNFRYLTSLNKINKNEKFSLNNISFKRQKKTSGLLPKFFFKIEGKKAKRNIKKNTLIKFSDVK